MTSTKLQTNKPNKVLGLQSLPDHKCTQPVMGVHLPVNLDHGHWLWRVRRYNLAWQGTSLGLWTARRTPRFRQNLENWITRRAGWGVTLRNYGLHMLLSVVFCLFGPWTLALKGATLQFGMARHLAWSLNGSETAPIPAKSWKLDHAKSRLRCDAP